MTDLGAHKREIQANIAHWKQKPLLREIYLEFQKLIATQLTDCSSGPVVEIGSGVADITEVIPECIRTDLFPNTRGDRIENAYELSFGKQSISNLILFDVFHHLRYPGSALDEFHRVLASRGRLIIFDPCLSVLGWLVYGLLHREPIGFKKEIHWHAPADWDTSDIDYYAAQGNASRIFLHQEVNVGVFGWKALSIERLSSLSYVASGGYSGPQMYPLRALPIMRSIDRLLDRVPWFFGTRLLVVLEKTDDAEAGSRGSCSPSPTPPDVRVRTGRYPEHAEPQLGVQ